MVSTHIRMTRGSDNACVSPSRLGLREAPEGVRGPVHGALLVRDPLLCHEWQLARAPLHRPAAASSAARGGGVAKLNLSFTIDD